MDVHHEGVRIVRAQNPGTGTGPATILTGDLRGDVGSIIVQNGDYIAWCVGTDSAPVYLLLNAHRRRSSAKRALGPRPCPHVRPSAECTTHGGRPGDPVVQ